MWEEEYPTLFAKCEQRPFIGYILIKLKIEYCLLQCRISL